MKKLFIHTGFALVCGFAASAFAYDLTLNDTGLKLTVNGQDCLDESSAPALINVQVSNTTINIATSGEEFSCGGVTGLPPSSSSSSSSISSVSSSSSSAGGGTPAPGVDLSACGGLWPTGVTQGKTLALDVPIVRDSVIPMGNNPVSFPIQTLNPGLNNRVGAWGVSSTLGVSRTVWISACPGGEAVSPGNCSATGVETLNIRARQGSGSATIYCPLESNKQYFINVKNNNCSQNGRCELNFSL